MGSLIAGIVTWATAGATGWRVRARRGVAIATTMVAIGMVRVAISLFLRPETITGHVTAVYARDIGHASTVNVRDSVGVEHSFDVATEVDMTPAHLREHMLFGEAVTVTVGAPVEGSTRRRAVRIVDAGE